MNRIFMRALGGCMAVYGVFFGRDASAVIDGVIYEGGTKTVSEIYVSRDLTCSVPTMLGAYSGVCTSNGTFSTDPDYFVSMGCGLNATGEGATCSYVATGGDIQVYLFKGCKAGFFVPAEYKNVTGTFCSAGVTGTTGLTDNDALAPEQLSLCCMPCPEFSYTFGSGTGVTSSWDGVGENCNDNWCWAALLSDGSGNIVTGTTGVMYGMESCVATHKNAGEVYSDAMGSYTYNNEICTFKTSSSGSGA